MDNDTTLPQDTSNGQEMVTVQTTPLFYSKEAMSKAALLAGGSKETIAFAWCKVMLERGAVAKTGTLRDSIPTKFTMEKRFATTSGFSAMERAGMIIVTNQAAKSELGDEHFEQFWQAYPAREARGSAVPTKGSKQNARRMFDTYITSTNKFVMMMSALEQYKLTIGNFPKDAERFLRKNFYVDYLPEKMNVATDGMALATTPPTDDEKLRIQRDREQRLRQTTGNGEGRADNVGVGVSDSRLDAVSSE